MAKIDLSTIEGFDSMSAEDKVKALSNYEFSIPEDKSGEVSRLNDEIKKHKDMISSYSSQIAEFKRKEREHMSDEEKSKLDAESRYKDLEDKYNELLKSHTVSEYINRYVSQGYSPELAKEKAEAFADGDTEKVFECEEKYRKELEKKFRIDVLKGTARPDDKGGSKAVKSKEDIYKIKDTIERQRAIAENAELFGIS